MLRSGEATDSSRGPVEPQLTPRAVVVGVLLGLALSVASVYAALRTGTSIGAGITASVAGFGAMRAARAAGVVKAPLGALENSAIVSVASSASFMVAGGNLAAVGALFAATGARPDVLTFAPWMAAIALLGILVAIPLKARLVHVDRLPFPSGTATAVTIRCLHEQGAADGRPRIMALAAALGGAVTLARRFVAAFVAAARGPLSPPVSLFGHAASSWTIGIEPSPLLVGAGMLIGVRTGCSLILGAAVTYAGLGPHLAATGAIGAVSYRAILTVMVWPGAAVLIAAAIVDALPGVRRSRLAPQNDATSLSRPAECPLSWLAVGFAVIGPLLVGWMRARFDIPWWIGTLLVVVSSLLAAVAARVVGETDAAPTKAFGAATQGLLGALLPGRLVAVIMGANVAGGVALHASDMLTDWKTGTLLGARPRPQLAAQAIGVVVGAVTLVPTLLAFAPDAAMLGSDALPAPSVLVWLSVAKALAGGVDALPPAALDLAVPGAFAGAALAIAARAAPRGVRSLLPSAAGVGMGMILPAHVSAALFVGALMGWAIARHRAADSKASHAESIPALASGLVLGESVVGTIVALVARLP